MAARDQSDVRVEESKPLELSRVLEAQDDSRWLEVAQADREHCLRTRALVYVTDPLPSSTGLEVAASSPSVDHATCVSAHEPSTSAMRSSRNPSGSSRSQSQRSSFCR